jgi:DNA-binding beta-propeller fold protein YncE
MKAAPGPADRRLLRAYATDGPDNIAFGQSGKLYVALAISNQIAVIDFATGNEVRRFSGPAKGKNGDVAWDAPAGVAFDNSSKSLRVTNHALVSGAANPGLFVEFDVYVNDTALPLHRPKIYAIS